MPDSREKRDSQDPARMSWPPQRADFIAVSCVLLSAYCVVTSTWLAFAVVSILVAVFAAVSPRMVGRWLIQLWKCSVEGQFDPQFVRSTRPESDDPPELGPFQDPLEPRPPQESLPRRGSDVD